MSKTQYSHCERGGASSLDPKKIKRRGGMYLNAQGSGVHTGPQTTQVSTSS